VRKLGETVQQGDVLALVDSLEVGKAKSELSRSIVHWQHRTKTLAGARKNADVIPRQQLREAETAAEEAELSIVTAQQALINLGFDIPDGLEQCDVKELTRKLQCLGLPKNLCDVLQTRAGLTLNLIPIRAPQAGMIVDMDLVAGEVVSSDKLLITLADLSRLWLTLHARQEDAKLISVGQSVRFQLDGSDLEVQGQVDWVASHVDPVTRTVRVRVTLPNPGGRLKANSFGTGWVMLREEPKAITVPLDALQSDGDCFIVFVRDKNFLKDGSPKVFHTRQVRPAARTETHVELLAGVLPGEVVASKGSASLRAELLKTGMGEGCGHHH
jgi:cobalt-zinc-cadmium efflux system membrane fusion protein